MPIFVYWGEDDFAMQKAILQLRDRAVDPQWLSFNYTCIAADRSDNIILGLNEVMTPPFGAGNRFVWLVDTTLAQQCPQDVLAELQRTLPVIPESSVLLLSCRSKPDGRLKSTQLLQQYGTFCEFALIPPWKTEELVIRVQQAAAELQIKLTSQSIQLLAECVGNNTRQLSNELEKLRTFAADSNKPIDADTVARLVINNTRNSLQLATAIKTGNVAQAIALVSDLVNCNEPGLKIVATLTAQFRTWLWVKLASGDRDIKAVATLAEVANPKRVYFLQQEVNSIALEQLTATLPLLLELEVSLKQGVEEFTTLQVKVIELCQIFNRKV